MTKYTIRCESSGRKVPILWGKYVFQFLSLFLFDWFCRTFLYYEKIMGRPMHLPCDKVYHSMGI